MSDQQLAVEMRGITKQFPGVLANNHVDLSVRTGEIHALVGENGAGKSTLMNILYGLIRPDSGEIFINGKPVHMAGPRDAISLGIGMVHQHFMLIPVFSVGENIMLGREPVTGTDLYDHARARNAINDLTKRYGLALDPDARMGDLPVGLQQRAEIVKVLYRGAGILILDEPTGVLTPQETKELFVVLRDLVKSGKTIIFISHKLKEVLEISDRITVMRRGKVVGHLTTSHTNVAEVATRMVGREVLLSFSITENSILGRERSPKFSWHEFVLRLVAIREWARRLVKEFDVRTPSIDVAARNLSGGNQQKVIVAREMGSKPKVLLAAQPTRGVDIGAIEFIHRRIVQERDEGTAVLLVSAELDEVRSLSDRIAVMYEGRIVSIEPPDAAEERLGLLMTGGGAPREGAA